MYPFSLHLSIPTSWTLTATQSNLVATNALPIFIKQYKNKHLSGAGHYNIHYLRFPGLGGSCMMDLSEMTLWRACEDGWVKPTWPESD